MKFPKILIHLAALLSLSFSASACAGTSPTESEVRGVWSGPAGAKLELLSGGVLSLKNIPEDYFLLNGSQKPISGQGKWRLMQSAGQSALIRGANWWDVELSIFNFDAHPGGARTVIHYAWAGKRKVLFFWKNEEGGERLEFYKH